MFLPSKKIRQVKYSLQLIMMKDLTLKAAEEIPMLLTSLCKKVKSLKKTIKRKNTAVDKKLYCRSSLKKSELVYIFYLLMDDGILFFDVEDPVKNRSMFQQFLQTNFTYSGDAGIQSPLRSVSREFSEARGYTYRDKQLRMLNRIIRRLEQRKERI